MILTLLLVSMLVLCLLGMPLVFALLGSSVITLLVARPDLPWSVLPQLFVSGIDNYALLAVPLFFLAGELMTASGVIDRILRVPLRDDRSPQGRAWSSFDPQAP